MKINKIIILSIIFSFLMILIPYSDNVKAISVINFYGFENAVDGAQVSLIQSGLFNTEHSGADYSRVSTSYVHVGTKAFYGYSRSVADSIAFWNFTYSENSFLTNFSFYAYSPALNNQVMGIYLYMYNKTLGLTNPIIYTRWFTSGSNYFYYYDSNGNPHSNTFTNSYSGGQYYINFINNLGDVNYCQKGKFSSLGTARNSTAINQGYRIDIFKFVFDGTSSFTSDFVIDDINITISDSYSGGTQSGSCVDTDGYDFFSKNIGVQSGWIDINSPFIEFTSHSKLSLTPYAFELWVGSSMYQYDNDSNNYYLYINGVSIGSATCFYFLSGQNYVLQWDLGSISPFVDEILVFEIAHSNKIFGDIYWNVAKSKLESPPSPTSVSYKNTATNGILDGTVFYYGMCWKLYYSAFGTPDDEENSDYTVGLNLVGFKPSNPLWNTPYVYIYDTIWFEIFSNRTDNFYHVNISIGATATGQEQNYPIKIYSYHDIISFTPTQQGNYTVSLCKESDNAIVDHKHFNVTSKDIDYAIWTFPNPSNYGGEHGIGVYILDDETFNDYYITGVGVVKSLNNFSNASVKIHVGILDLNNYWSTSVLTFMINAPEYWRLWGTNDNSSFIPLTSPYTHFVNSLSNYNYIRTSLSNNEGIVDVSFNVYGQHSYILSSLKVYLDNQPIKDVSTDYAFMIPYSFSVSEKGTHVFSLKVLNDGVWEIVDEVSVTIYEESDLIPVDDDFSNFFKDLPDIFKYMVGLVIVIITTLSPLLIVGVVKKDFNLSSIPQFLYMVMAIVGYCITIVFGFFPSWSVVVVVVLGALIISIMYLQKKNTVSG
jgi:hypothetical protein